MSKHPKVSEKLVGWLANFADQQGAKNGAPEVEQKSAGYIDNILDIVNRNKKNSVEAKVEELRQRVGLDMIQNIEKAGEQEETKTASVTRRRPLSIRDKVAASEPDMNKVKEYIDQTIQNRNGAVATPAIFEQIETYLNVDRNWMLANSDKLEKLVNDAREKFTPQSYHDENVEELTRTDSPKGEKEAPPFLPPATPPVT